MTIVKSLQKLLSTKGETSCMSKLNKQDSSNNSPKVATRGFVPRYDPSHRPPGPAPISKKMGVLERVRTVIVTPNNPNDH